MCLYLGNNSNNRRNFIKRFNPDKDGNVIMYKILFRNKHGKYFSGMLLKPLKITQPFISDRKQRRLSIKERKYQNVDYGIHVYTTLALARQAQYITQHDKIVSVRCNMCDFVATDTNLTEAVFMKVECLPMSQWKRYNAT